MWQCCCTARRWDKMSVVSPARIFFFCRKQGRRLVGVLEFVKKNFFDRFTMMFELMCRRKISGEQQIKGNRVCLRTIGVIVALWKFDVLKTSILLALKASLPRQIFQTLCKYLIDTVGVKKSERCLLNMPLSEPMAFCPQEVSANRRWASCINRFD